MGETYLVTLNQRTYSVAVEDAGEGKLRVVVDGRERIVDARRIGAGAWSIIDGVEARLVEVDGVAPKLSVEVSHADGETRQAVVEIAREGVADVGDDAGRPPPSGPTRVRAPIPGKVVKVLVKIGDQVKAGQTLLVLEAMKMENELRAPRAAAVLALSVSEGTAVEMGQELVLLG